MKTLEKNFLIFQGSMDLNGDYESLSIKCALNDTSDFFARADFLIYADSYLVASVLNVSKGEIRSIDVNLNKCKKITLNFFSV